MFYNNLLINKDNNFNSAFNTFKDNIDSDSSITKDIDVLDKNYEHIPYEFRDSDLTMIAGAYGTSKICAYDSNGDIVDFGFSRSTTRHRVFNDIVDTDINVPRLDNMCYNESIGYTIEGATTFIGRSRPLSVFNLTAIYGNSIFASPSIFMEQAGGSYRNINWDMSVYPTLTTITNTTVFKPINPSGRNLLFRFGNDSLEVNINVSLTTLEIIAKGNRILNASIRKLSNGYILLNYTILPITNPVPNFSSFRYYPTFSTGLNYSNNAGDVNTGFEIVNMTISDTNSESFNINNTTNDTFLRGADTITPITLTNNAVIFIKTAKGAKLLTLPSGTFNIHDYISNDKLICLTIKYI